MYNTLSNPCITFQEYQILSLSKRILKRDIVSTLHAKSTRLKKDLKQYIEQFMHSQSLIS